ncbi:uncharacterized protein LOC124165466 [Ischnura elegans]|uniref:uncharacterized protein LOC124165466 n=1 Tax=Ischnura elegans TaxID=197161 RepID=UPI001ED8BE9D|nr:uncharacterized protein LOC124165466 [Ischnura elegans]
MAKWVIVKFLDSLDDEEPAFTFCVIPTSWLETDDGADYARWPPSTNSQKELKAIKKMIQDCTPVCIEWPIHIFIEKTPEIDTYKETKEYEKCIGKLGQGRNLLKGYEARRQALLNKKKGCLPQQEGISSRRVVNR